MLHQIPPNPIQKASLSMPITWNSAGTSFSDAEQQLLAQPDEELEMIIFMVT